MVKRCAAKGCNAKENQGLMLFKFPKEAERRMKWILLVNRANWQPITNSVLCEIHFGNEQWEQKRIDGSRRLKWSAVPSLLSSNVNASPGPYNPIVNEHNYCHLPDSLAAEICGTHLQAFALANETKEENSPVTQLVLEAEKFSALSVGKIAEENTVEICDERLELDEKKMDDVAIQEMEENVINVTHHGFLSNEKAALLAATETPEENTIRALRQRLQVKEKQLEGLQKKFDSVQKLTKKIYTSYCKKKMQNEAMRAKMKRLQNSRRSDSSVLNRLRQDQFEGLRSKTTRGKQWSIPTIIDGLAYKMKWGTRDYSKFVKDFPIFPAIRTLQRLAHKVEQVKFDAGMLRK